MQQLLSSRGAMVCDPPWIPGMWTASGHFKQFLPIWILVVYSQSKLETCYCWIWVHLCYQILAEHSFLTFLMFVHVARPWVHMGITYWAVVKVLFVFLIWCLYILSYFKSFFKIISALIDSSIFWLLWCSARDIINPELPDGQPTYALWYHCLNKLIL